MTRSPRFPRLDRPPIVEALLDFSAQFAETVSPEALAVDPAGVLGEGASSSPIQSHTAEIFFGGAEPSNVSTGFGITGYRFQNAAADRVAQFRTDGMTYSMVRDYTTWEELQREAVTAFAVYQRAVGAPVPFYPAARFINLIEIPFDVPLGQFLQIEPPIPGGLNVGVTAFHARTDLYFAEARLAGAITLTTPVAPADARAGSVFLDVVVRSERAFTIGVEEPVPPPLAEEFRRIREAKNAVFFGSLTPQALSVYQDPR